jgi:hypothetical protein
VPLSAPLAACSRRLLAAFLWPPGPASSRDPNRRPGRRPAPRALPGPGRLPPARPARPGGRAVACLPPSRALGLGPRLVVPEARQMTEREAWGSGACPRDHQSLAAGKPQREAMRLPAGCGVTLPVVDRGCLAPAHSLGSLPGPQAPRPARRSPAPRPDGPPSALGHSLGSLPPRRAPSPRRLGRGTNRSSRASLPRPVGPSLRAGRISVTTGREGAPDQVRRPVRPLRCRAPAVTLTPRLAPS